MEKMMILELGQEIWKMILEQFVWCENKKEKKKCSKNFQKRKQQRGGAKMAEVQVGETTFSPTNSSKV